MVAPVIRRKPAAIGATRVFWQRYTRGSAQRVTPRLVELQGRARIVAVDAGGPFPDIANTIVETNRTYSIGLTVNRACHPGAASSRSIRSCIAPIIAPRIAALGLAVRIPAGGFLPFRFQRQAHSKLGRQ